MAGRNLRSRRTGRSEPTSGERDLSNERDSGEVTRLSQAAVLPQSAWEQLAAFVIVAMTATRFVALELSPPGFYNDESAGALNSICIAQTGADQAGTRWPLFFHQYNEWTSPLYVYFDASWYKLFGPSIASFRSASALFGALTVLGIYLLARCLTTRVGALLAALSAAISPALFHFSRISWASAMLPTFLVWGLYFAFRSDRKRDVLMSGVLLGLGCYTYLAGRLVVPLLLPLIAWLRHARIPARSSRYAVFLMALAVTSAPLVYFTLFGDISSRANEVGITSDSFLQSHPGPHVPVAMTFFITNLIEQFDPSFLFLHGDANPRHGLGFVGHLSWLDVFALLAGVVMFVRYAISNETIEVGELARRSLRFAMAAFVIGMVPAALTWESLPHAQRACAAWPFGALLAGLLLGRAQSIGWPIMKPAAITSAAFVLFFVPAYFYRFPPSARKSFEDDLNQQWSVAVATKNGDAVLRIIKARPALPLRYQLIAERGMSCDASRVFIDVYGSFGR